MAPKRPEDCTQDEMARGLLSARHQLNVWGSRPPQLDPSPLLGTPHVCKLPFRNRLTTTDLILYDVRFCPGQHWIWQVARRWPGLLALTARQFGQLGREFQECALGLAVEGMTGPPPAISEDVPIIQLNWPYPKPERQAAWSRPGKAARLLLLLSEASDLEELAPFLARLRGLPVSVRLLSNRLSSSLQPWPDPRVRFLPRQHLQQELERASLVIQLAEAESASTYFEMMRVLAASAPSLAREVSWLSPRAGEWRVPQNLGQIDWDLLAERVEELLLCPWELEALSRSASQHLEDQHSPVTFLKTLEDFAQQDRVHQLALTRRRLFGWLKRENLAVPAATQEIYSLFTATSSSPGRMAQAEVAYLSPLPPERSGVAVYSAQLLGALKDCLELDLFSRAHQGPASAGQEPQRTFAYSEFLARDRRQPYLSAVYHVGNNLVYHHAIAELAQRRPGIVVLHDTHVGDLMFGLDPSWRAFKREFKHALGGRAQDLLEELKAGRRSAQELMRLTLNRRLVERSLAVVVHSEWDRQAVLRDNPEAEAKISVVPLCTPLSSPTTPEQREASRARLGLPEDCFLVASFGFLGETKKPESIVRNLAPFLRSRPQARLVFVGQLPGEDYGRRLQAFIESSPVSQQIQITGFLPWSLYESYLRACDLSIQLRQDFRCGGALSVNQSLAQGLPTLITADGPFLEYPSEVVRHLPVEQEPGLSDLVEECYQDPEGLRELGRRAWCYARDRFAPAGCAQAYARIIRETQAASGNS